MSNVDEMKKEYIESLSRAASLCFYGGTYFKKATLSQDLIDKGLRDCDEFLRKAEDKLSRFDRENSDLVNGFLGQDFFSIRYESVEGFEFLRVDLLGMATELRKISCDFGVISLRMDEDGKVYEE